MSEYIDIKKIFSLLPHRYPMILVDRVLDFKAFECLTALKNVTINENFFVGHFPENPIMPGVLMLEALAQAGALFSALSQTPEENEGIIHFFAGIDNAKFKHVVVPGDQLRLEIKLLARKRDFWRVHGEVYVGDKMACCADLLSAARNFKSDK